jgi:tetratricopeptide (TPR) repeat protein
MNREVLCVAVLAILGGMNGCSTPPVRHHDEELKALSKAGKSAYEQGRSAKAAKCYYDAYQRGLMIDEPLEAGRNAYNAALCHIELNELADAEKLLGEAFRLLDSDRSALIKVELAAAETAFRGGDLKKAENLVNGVISSKKAEIADLGHADILLAEIKLDQGDSAEATLFHKKAQRIDADALGPVLAARREGVLARLVCAGLVDGNAGDVYISQADQLKKCGAYREMAAVLMKAGDDFSHKRRFEDAFLAYERALNGFVALNDKGSASICMAKVLDISQQLDEGLFKDRIRLLRVAAER